MTNKDLFVKTGVVNSLKTLSTLEQLELAYQVGLLTLEHKNLYSMFRHGFLPCSNSYAARLLATYTHPYLDSLQPRLSNAPHNFFLAIDITLFRHSGSSIEGIAPYYISQGNYWGLSVATAVLITPDTKTLPYPVGFMPNLRPYLHTSTYPSMTPSEVALSITRKVARQHPIRGVVMDGGMIKRSQLYKLRCLGIPFVARIPNSHLVKYTEKQVYGTEKEIEAMAGIKIKELAQLFPPSKAHWYPKLECYAKKVKVYLPNVGKVWLMINWWRKGTGVELSVLVFSAEEMGVQEIIRAYKARWGDEVMHRLLKQNLGAQACQSPKFVVQMKHLDLCISAFGRVREHLIAHPKLTFREAQIEVGENLKNLALTGYSSTL